MEVTANSTARTTYLNLGTIKNEKTGKWEAPEELVKKSTSFIPRTEKKHFSIFITICGVCVDNIN